MASRPVPGTRASRAPLVLVVVAIGIALALVLWFLRAGRATDPLESSPTLPATATDSPRAEPLAHVADDARSSAIDVEAKAPVALDAAAPDPDADDHEPVEVLVLDKETGEPVAGADVRWANFGELEFRGSEAPHWRPDPIAHMANARRTTTDESGIAHIDTRVFPGRILARHGSRFGSAPADSQMPIPIVVSIAPELGLVIQVVDEAGQPVAGVPVCLRAVPHLETMGEMWLGTTEGPEGLAHVRSLGYAQPGAAQPTSAFACLDVVLAQSVCVPVDLANPPAEPVKLVLPPCGSVEIGIHDDEGRPASPLLLHLGLASKADKKGDLRWGSRGFEADVVREGFALYRFVGLGLDLHAVAMKTGGNATARGPGPRVAGETARLELALGPPCVTFVGRLVTERGEPIRDRFVLVNLQCASGGNSTGSYGTTLRTDAGGRFRMSTFGAVGVQVHASLRVKPSGVGFGEGLEAQLETDFESVPPDADLGDVIAREVPPLGSGVVVDESGAPLTGAALSIQIVRPNVQNGAWLQHPLVGAEMRPDGTFEIRSTLEPTRLRVSATKNGFAASAPVEFEPGRSDLRVVLPGATELRGRALLDPDVDPKRVRVRLLVPGAPMPTTQLGPDREVRLADDGTFRIAPIAAGRYDLDFRFLMNGVPFHRIDGIDVERGGSVDARLDAIDLRGLAPKTGPR